MTEGLLSEILIAVLIAGIIATVTAIAVAVIFIREMVVDEKTAKRINKQLSEGERNDLRNE